MFSWVAALGFFIATFPHDIFSAQHTIGSAFMVGSLWFLAVFFLDDIRLSEGSGVAFRYHAVLQLTVVSYAIGYCIDSPIKQILQKIAVFGLSYVLLASTNVLCRCDKSAEPLAEFDEQDG